MKAIKRVVSLFLCASFICVCLTGCSSKVEEKYSDTTLIIGYTDSVAPFLEVDANGNATGFVADLWQAIFNSVKGDLKDYCFEKVEEGYALEEDGGFLDSKNKEYSAGLLMGAVSKNNSTFNEDYSFTEPIVTNRVIAIVNKESKIKNYSDFDKTKAIVVGDAAMTSFEKQATIYAECDTVSKMDKIDSALTMLDNGSVDVVITDEFTFMPTDSVDGYTILDGEIDTIEYVIACAKYSGWKNSINEAIREYKSEKYNKNGDEFTPLVEKYFGYNASSFNYETEGDK